MAKMCVRCNKKLSFFEKSIICAICTHEGCEKCLNFGFSVQDSLWRKMVNASGEKNRLFNIEGDLIERSVCSVIMLK